MKLFEKKDFGSNGEYCYYYLFGKQIGRRNGKSYYFFNDHYIFWHSWSFNLTYNLCGYEDGNAELHISMFGIYNIFKLPWKSKKFPYGDCNVPQYGISITNNTVWIHKGGNGNMGGGSKWWSFDLPFFTKECVRHSVVCNLNTEDEPELYFVDFKKLQFKGDDWKPLYDISIVYKYHYNFKDKFDNSIVPCVFWVEEIEKRPKWLKWTKKFKTIERYIEVYFKQEIGHRKETWKGGTIECSYELLPNETPIECIKRMEKERIF